METDEYSITLGRELNLCRKLAARIGREIEALETRHGRSTESVIAASIRGELPADNAEYAEWVERHKELVLWRERAQEYERLYRGMRR